MGWARSDGGWEFRSDDPRAPRAWIEMSPDRSRSVVIENHGEHHMGAESIVIVPDRPIAGVTRFHTTNGPAQLDPTGRWLIVEGVIGERPQSVQPDMGDHLGPAAFHHHVSCAVSVHLGSALLLGMLQAFTPAVSPVRRAFSRTQPLNHQEPVNNRG